MTYPLSAKPTTPPPTSYPNPIFVSDLTVERTNDSGGLRLSWTNDPAWASQLGAGTVEFRKYYQRKDCESGEWPATWTILSDMTGGGDTTSYSFTPGGSGEIRWKLVARVKESGGFGLAAVEEGAVSNGVTLVRAIGGQANLLGPGRRRDRVD